MSFDKTKEKLDEYLASIENTIAKQYRQIIASYKNDGSSEWFLRVCKDVLDPDSIISIYSKQKPVQELREGILSVIRTELYIYPPFTLTYRGFETPHPNDTAKFETMAYLRSFRNHFRRTCVNGCDNELLAVSMWLELACARCLPDDTLPNLATEIEPAYSWSEEYTIAPVDYNGDEGLLKKALNKQIDLYQQDVSELLCEMKVEPYKRYELHSKLREDYLTNRSTLPIHPCFNQLDSGKGETDYLQATEDLMYTAAVENEKRNFMQWNIAVAEAFRTKINLCPNNMAVLRFVHAAFDSDSPLYEQAKLRQRLLNALNGHYHIGSAWIGGSAEMENARLHAFDRWWAETLRCSFLKTLPQAVIDKINEKPTAAPKKPAAAAFFTPEPASLKRHDNTQQKLLMKDKNPQRC